MNTPPSTGHSTGAPLRTRKHRRSTGAPDTNLIPAGQATGHSTGATGTPEHRRPPTLLEGVGACQPTATRLAFRHPRSAEFPPARSSSAGRADMTLTSPHRRRSERARRSGTQARRYPALVDLIAPGVELDEEVPS